MLVDGRWIKWILGILCFCMTTLSYAQIAGQVHDSEGRLMKLSDLHNKWIVVNYWAEWCGGCVEEIPELNRFYQHNQDKNIVVLGVNYDQPPSLYLQQSIRRIGIEFPVLQEDPRMLWQLGDIAVLPTTFIINPQGDVVRKIIGPNTEQSLMKVVQNRLAAKGKKKKSAIG